MRPPDGSHRPFLWLKSHRPNWLLWSPFGVSSKQVTLRGEWPQQFVAIDDTSERQYPLRGYSERDIVIDHFGWHPDGVVLMKAAGETPIYSQKMTHKMPLDAKSPVFLQLNVQTEVAAAYRNESVLPQHAVVIPTQLGSGVGVYIAAAGREYPMSEYLRDTSRPSWKVGPVFTIGNFVVGVSHWSRRPDAQLSPDRTRGTLVGIRFLLESNVFCHKTFLFQ